MYRRDWLLPAGLSFRLDAPSRRLCKPAATSPTAFALVVGRSPPDAKSPCVAPLCTILHDYPHYCTLEMSRPNLLLDERHRLIRERLAAEGRVLATDLARDLGTSEDTIRRDLRELASLGECRRVYGGALSISPASGTMAERQTQDVDRKAALAREAVELVVSGQIIFLDAGSTNLAIARALPKNANLTVATNAPAIALALLDKVGIDVILVGGVMDVRAGAALGAQAVRDASGMAPDICFVGACAADLQQGVGAFGFEDAVLKRALVEEEPHRRRSRDER